MALAELKTAASVLLDRYQWARQVGLTFGGKRDTYGILGYADSITTRQYVTRYERGGIAGRIVDCLPKACWRGDMWCEEDEDPNVTTVFEQVFKGLEKKLKIKMMLQRADILSRLSTYSVLLIGAGGQLDEELPKGGQLLYLSAFLGGGGPASGNARSLGTAFDADATIAEYDTDMASPRFGLPKFYQLRRTDISMPLLARQVHWSRVIHCAEGLLQDDVFGQPALMRVWNDLDNLEKVVGGGAEAFWIRCNGGLHVNVDKDMALAPSADELSALKQQAEDYQHQLTRMIRTRGVEVNQLGSDVANFSNPADAIVQLISGATGIPKRILLGSEQGELASTQDRENFRDLVNGRQTGYLTPCLVQPLVDRLIAYGYLPAADYKVQWPHIEVLGEKEKVDGAKGWATVNQTMGSVVYTPEEIRDHWSGLAPLSDGQKQEIADENAQKVADAQAAMAPAAESVIDTPELKAALRALEEQIENGLTAEDIEESLEGFEAELRALEVAIENDDAEAILEVLGDVEGHPFHGNQWTSASGAMVGPKGKAFVKEAHTSPETAAIRQFKKSDASDAIFEQAHAALEQQGYVRTSPFAPDFKSWRDSRSELAHPETGMTAKLHKFVDTAQDRNAGKVQQGISTYNVKLTVKRKAGA